MGEPDGAEQLGEIHDALAELWAEQRGTALDRVGVLEDAAAALASGALGDDQREAARSAAHKLRGSSGTYGFHHASELAGELEDMLVAGPIDVERTPQVASIVLALRTELEGEPKPGGAGQRGASGAGATVLAVDDDPAVLAALRALLEPRGYEYVPLSDPTEFWSRLEETDPDLAVIDLDMPRVDGLDICRAVRSDPAWAHLPLLILTAYRDPEFMRNAFAAGADDFVAKPIEEEELVARIANRLERVRAARESTGRDVLTGLPTRQRALAQISHLLEADPGAAMPVALIAVRGLEPLNARAGQRAGDERLRELAASLEREFPHAAGRYGGAKFVALLPPSAASDPAGSLNARLDRVLGGREGLELVAAIAHAEQDTLDATLAAAEQILKSRAGPRIRIVGDRLDPGIDVVYVEDEASVADVLQLALDTLGLTSQRFDDGTSAIEALAGDQPELRARVILLDWDLPGLDGLSVLRQLAADGVLESTRVIMLTARAGEGETVRALELGASDYIAKPFSVPVLVERVRGALER